LGVGVYYSFFGAQAHLAQSVERVLGKDEVTSSTLVVGSTSQDQNNPDSQKNNILKTGV
jgi:hypothetical protein